MLRLIFVTFKFIVRFGLIGLVCAVLASFVLNQSELTVTKCSMASQFETLLQAFREQNKTAFVLGYTGEVGKEVVKSLLAKRLFKRLVLIGRRTVAYDDELYKDVEQKVIDFDKLDEHADVFKDLDIGYCCLGTTRGKSGADGFYKVDHDYVVNSARLAKQAGCSQFHLISSQGANSKSSFLYPKTKGEVEEELKAMNFTNLFIYRPAMLLCEREESRTMERVAKAVIRPITWAFPTFISVPTSTVAMATVNKTVTPAENAVELLDNKDIHKLGSCHSGDSSSQ